MFDNVPSHLKYTMFYLKKKHCSEILSIWGVSSFSRLSATKTKQQHWSRCASSMPKSLLC